MRKSLNKVVSFLTTAVMTFGAFACNVTTKAETVDDSDSNWVLKWSDEFDGNQIDMNKWSYELGNWKLDANGNYITNGWGNNEQQIYTNKNATVKDGKLTIAARKETYTDPVQGTYDYTSSRLSSQYKFSTCGGRIEVRSRCDSEP